MTTIHLREDQRDCLIDCLSHLIGQAKARLEKGTYAIDDLSNQLCVSRLHEIRELLKTAANGAVA